MTINEDEKKNFKITHGKGFHITFENGYTVSVQWGPGNYCDHYDVSGMISLSRAGYIEQVRVAGEVGSNTAEVAVWGPDGSFENLMPAIDRDDEVTNRSTPAEVLKIMTWAASLKQTTPTTIRKE